MDKSSDSIGESTPVCQCAPKTVARRWVPAFPIALCLLMSLSSITVSLLMSLKTYQLENRLQTEMDKAAVFQPSYTAFQNEDGTLVSELSTPIEKFVEEKVTAQMPKYRTARDVGQECACPPGGAVPLASVPLTPGPAVY
ncbi:unnamed protein product [Menidia menidia]|uniref:(Atlantic silverside) hypothetical protein n=1 Tax=Menidia menidia TaxID=238744 RepID=A0A8S4BHV9_9TELE|nr:unnamed protein product [Menidia menidia]